MAASLGGKPLSRAANLSVIVPAYEQAACLRSALAALERQSLPGGKFEVIVVDDGSRTDAVALACAEHKQLVRYIRLQENSGRAAARNFGVKSSSGAIVVFLDSCALACAHLLEEHQKIHSQDPDIEKVAFGKRVEAGWWTFNSIKDGKGDVTPQSFEVDPRQVSHGFGDCKVSPVPWLAGYTHNMSLSRRLFDAVEGFDESFTGWGFEDMEFSYRIYKHLGREPRNFVTATGAVCYHMPHLHHWEMDTRSGALNLRRFIGKYRHWEPEVVSGGIRVFLAEILPYYESCLKYMREHTGRVEAGVIADVLGPSTGRDLWIGFAVGANAAADRITFDHAPGASGSQFIGLRTMLATETLERVVNIDVWRMLLPDDLGTLISEGLRVAKFIVLVMSKAMTSSNEARIGLADDPDYVVDIVGRLCGQVAIVCETEEFAAIRCDR